MEKRKASIFFVTLWLYCVLQSQYCFVKSLKTIKEELIVQLMPLKMLRPLLLYNKEAFFFYSCLGNSQLRQCASNPENTIYLRFPSCWQIQLAVIF